MTTAIEARPPRKDPTGIAGLDTITEGGLPAGRITLVVGAPGTAKTVLAAQLLISGIARGAPAVFVTFEESPAEIAGNVRSFGWDIGEAIAAGTWRFVDASLSREQGIITGDFELEPLIARIEHAVFEAGAKRLVLDSADALFARFEDPGRLRFELRRLADRLRELDVVTVMTAGALQNLGATTVAHPVEEYVADNVIVVRNELDEERRRRTIEVLKLRGSGHLEGRYPFTIVPDAGIAIVPMAEMDIAQGSSDARVRSGAAPLDAMCGGGFFRDSIILASGATGTGKTLLSSHFVRAGDDAGDRSLLLAYEESHDQIFRNARGWGFDFAGMEARETLKVSCTYPEAMSLQKHLIRVEDLIDEYRPDRLAIDSLSALERVGSVRTFREFVIGLSSLVKRRGLTCLMTASTPTLTGGTSITEAHISTLTDTIILLRYVESFGRMRRGLTVLKMRGSLHDKEIREFTIDHEGMHLGRTFSNVSGILSGAPTHSDPDEVQRMSRLFESASGDGA